MVPALSGFVVQKTREMVHEVRKEPKRSFIAILATFGAVCAEWGVVRSLPQDQRSYAIAGCTFLNVGLLAVCRRFFTVNHPSDEKISIDPSWDELTELTKLIPERCEYLDLSQCNHRFLNVRCPVQTIIGLKIDDHFHFLHANTAGQGMGGRTFNICQAPLLDDFPTFWKLVFRGGDPIFDLSTQEEFKDELVDVYYPDQSTLAIQHGSIRIDWIETKKCVHKYKLTETTTGEVKWIRRFHYPNWKDSSAVSLKVLKDLVTQFENLVPANKTAWILSRAGVGRSGTLVAAIILKEVIQQEEKSNILGEDVREGKTPEDLLHAALVGIVGNLRIQRGPLVVQTLAQFHLLREYTKDLLFEKLNSTDR